MIPEPARVSIEIDRATFDDIRRQLLFKGTGGLIDDRIPEIEMDDVVIHPRKVVSAEALLVSAARVAYTAYRESLHAVQTDPLPDWGNQTTYERSAWIDAATRLIDWFVHEP